MSTPSENTRWQCSLSLSESLSELRKRDMMTDVTFAVGTAPHVMITAHRLVLAARSPVFCTMFDGPLAESSEIEIPDIPGDIFSAILSFMYGEDVSITKENVEQMLYASEKYDLEPLKTKCDAFLSENLEECTDVLRALELSQKFNLNILCTKALDIIQMKTNKCFESVDFMILSKEAIKSVFDCDELSIEEIEVFRTAIKWAEAECTRQSLSPTDEHIRKTLGTILYSIRFPTMDGQTFCDNVYDRGILTKDEKCDIMRQLLSKREDKLNSQQFKSIPRAGATSEVLRFTLIKKSGWDGGAYLSAISFELSDNAYLLGILMYKRSDGLPYTLTITKGTETLSTQNEQGKSTTNILKNSMFEVRLPKRIHIRPNEIYTVNINPTGCFECYGQGGREKVEFGHRHVSFTPVDSSYCTDVNNGQLPGLLLRFI